jgi:hypothetical protein
MGLGDGRGKYDPARNERRSRGFLELIAALLNAATWW